MVRSADDGWVVTGGAAAELYGIATNGDIKLVITVLPCCFLDL